MNAIRFWLTALILLLAYSVALGQGATPEPARKSTPKEQGLVHPEYEEKGFQNTLGVLYDGMLQKQEQERQLLDAWNEKSKPFYAAEARERAERAAMIQVPPGTAPPREARDRLAEATLDKAKARGSMMEAFKAYADAKEKSAVARENYRKQNEAFQRQQELQQKADQPEPVRDPLSPAGIKDWQQLNSLDELCAILHLTLAEKEAIEQYEDFERSAPPGTNPLDSPQFRAVEEAARQKEQVVDRVLTGTLHGANGSTMEPRCSRCGLPLSLFNRACRGN